MFAGHLPEVIIVLVIAVIFLGPKRLPEAGRGLGKALKGFKDETKGLRDELTPVTDEATDLNDHVTSIKTDMHAAVTGSANTHQVEEVSRPTVDTHPVETTARPAEAVAVGTAIDNQNRAPEPDKPV